MKFLPLIFLVLVGCGASVQPQAPAPAPTAQAAPAQQFWHLSPIQLPAGEYFDGFHVLPRVMRPYMGNEDPVPEKYFFATTTTTPLFPTAHSTHTLRDSQGVPVLIVKD